MNPDKSRRRSGEILLPLGVVWAAETVRAGEGMGIRDAGIRGMREKTMPKAYWITCYRSITNALTRDAYTNLAIPAVLAGGGRFLARGNPAKTYEAGVDLRTVLIEFDSIAQATAAY